MKELMNLLGVGDKVLAVMYLSFLLCFVLVCHCKAYENPLPADFGHLMEVTGVVPSAALVQSQRRSVA